MWPKKLSGHTCGPKNFQATVAQKTTRPPWPRKQSGHCGPENNQATVAQKTTRPHTQHSQTLYSPSNRSPRSHSASSFATRTSISVSDGGHVRLRMEIIGASVPHWSTRLSYLPSANAPSSDADHRPQNFTPETPIAHDETRAAVQIRRASMLVVLAAATQYNTSAQH